MLLILTLGSLFVYYFSESKIHLICSNRFHANPVQFDSLNHPRFA